MPWKVERRAGKFVVLREDGKLVAEHDSKKKAMAQLRALYASEYWMKKAKQNALRKGRPRQFASRSEAGRYAAHIRWANSRGVEPMSIDQWRASSGDAPVVALQGMDLVRDLVGKAKQAVDEMEQRKAPIVPDPDDPASVPEYTKYGWRMADASPEEYARISKLALDGVDSQGNPVGAGNFIINHKGEIIPAKHMIETLEKVTKAGNAIEEEAIARAKGKLPADYQDQIQKSSDNLKQLQVEEARGRQDFKHREGMASRMMGEPWWKRPANGTPERAQWESNLKLITDAYQSKKAQLAQAQKDHAALLNEAKVYSDARLAVLSEIRSMGGKWDALDSPTKAIRSTGSSTAQTLAKPLQQALAKYVPTDLVANFNKHPKVVIEQTSGGGSFWPDYERTGTGVALVSLPSTRSIRAGQQMSAVGIGLHEMIHATEFYNPTRVHPLVATFRDNRAYYYQASVGARADVPAGITGSVTHSNQVPFERRIVMGRAPIQPLDTLGRTTGIRDMFGNAYSGRVYNLSERNHMGNEHLTTAVQGAFFGHEVPSRFAAIDSDQIGFALGVLATA